MRAACAKPATGRRGFGSTPNGGRAAALWWGKIQGKLARFNNLEVINLQADSTSALAELANRAMTLRCTVQDGQIGSGDEHQHLIVEPEHYR